VVVEIQNVLKKGLHWDGAVQEDLVVLDTPLADQDMEVFQTSEFLIIPLL